MAALLAGSPHTAQAHPWWLVPAAFTVAPAPEDGAAAATPVDSLPTRDVEIPPQPPASPQPTDPPADTDGTSAPINYMIPGVLTHEGVLVLEPSIQYLHASLNNFVAGGVAILDTVLVGNIQATQTNQDAVTGTAGFRYGVTNRLEVEARIPYMERSQSTTNTLVSTNMPQSTTDLRNDALGDIEGAVHYQVNDGRDDWPIFVANMRIKSNSGRGPFDVTRDSAGIETQLPTGSGFWAFEPSVTLVAPSDPAVFYANLGYLYNLSADENQMIGSQYLGRVNPGNAVRIGMGMGIALNEKVSFSLGYQHDFIGETTFHFSNGEFKSPSLSVGELNIGVNWQINQDTALNINVAVGVTRDAPDVGLMARMPISVKLFD